MNKYFIISRAICFVIFCALSPISFAQVDSLGLNSKWYAGFIELNDNTIRKGFIQHNGKLRLIKFKNKLNDMEELSYHEKRILTMEYFDTELSKKRKFYTLNIKEVDSGYAGAVLFEIIMEMKDFAVLSKRYAVQKARESSGGYREDARDAKIGYQQFESIYLVDDEAKVELLWTANVFDRGNAKPLTSPVPPFLDQDVLSKFTGSKWREVKDYIKEKRLHIKERADLLEALAYYKQLEPTE